MKGGAADVQVGVASQQHAWSHASAGECDVAAVQRDRAAAGAVGGVQQGPLQREPPDATAGARAAAHVPRTEMPMREFATSMAPEDMVSTATCKHRDEQKG